MKYATIAPQDFIPDTIFQNFPQLRTEYKATTNYNSFDQDLISANQITIEIVIE